MNRTERVVSNLNAALEDLRGQGFRLDSIYPADDPHAASMSRGEERVRVTTRPGAAPAGEIPPFAPEFVLTRAGPGGGQGRAGMTYRDLIPSRLGGRYIASHITIPDGGPVADWVHYHRIAFQMIAVRRGSVRVVYEDQGEPFVMRPGDLVLQPPEIRHRVLESSPGLEVVEVTCPALHETLADHELELPNGKNIARTFGGQRFVRHWADAPWADFHGWKAQQTDIGSATSELADVRFVRARGSSPLAVPAHEGELVFGFVLEGSAPLDFADGFQLGPADSFVVPPGEPWGLAGASPDFRLILVTTANVG